MDIIVLIATISSPIVAVIIAIWASRSGARDTAKQIAAVKELTKVQLELTKLKLDNELWDARIRHLQTSKRETDNYFYNQIGGLADSLRKMENEKRDLSDKFEFYSHQMKRLEYCIAKIKDIYAKMEGK